MKINFKKLAEAFGVELNEEFKIKNYVGYGKFERDGFYRRAFLDNGYTRVDNLFLNIEIERIV